MPPNSIRKRTRLSRGVPAPPARGGARRPAAAAGPLAEQDPVHQTGPAGPWEASPTRRPGLRLFPVLALFCTFALGCVLFPYEDPLVYQSLDYRVDRPRVLALDVSPPTLVSGVPVTLDALVMDPTRSTPTDVTWRTCGLRTDAWVRVWSLQCFTDDAEVSLLASGLPGTWTPPTFDIAPDTATWDAWSQVPVLMEARVGDETVRGVFHGALYADDSLFHGDPPDSIHGTPLTVTFGEVAGGQVEVTAWFGSPAESVIFRWYVDDGTLLDTGRTLSWGERDGGVYSVNRWVLPDGAGPWRVAVVVSGSEVSGVRDSDTGGITPEDWFFFDTPSMAWTVAELAP